MLNLLHYILASITNSEDIKINESQDEQGTVLEIEIPEEFRGLVIGKGGMNIKAIRNIVSIIARRENKRVFIKIKD